MAEYSEAEQADLRASGHWPAEDGTGHEYVAGQVVDTDEYTATGETTEARQDTTPADGDGEHHDGPPQGGMTPAEPQPAG